MNLPTDLKYTKEHEWLRTEGDTGSVGITHYALEQLGDVVFLEMPAVGTKLEAGSPFGTIESTKTVSDLYAPVTCEVVEVNQSLVDAPEELVKDVYENGWLIKIKITKESGELLSASEYENYLKSV